ncbi:MAG: ABC transporter ATP-binding protein [Actinobacteria bacterium RBG_16_67_10]|nr:MAG: ABC transporter ATP-binding protein [Actinobacteria bacterium RBG_16_67_10]
MLDLENVVSGYGPMEILHGITLHVKAGEIVSIIGPNGSGKSTLFSTIMGFVTPGSGAIRFGGQEITGLPPEEVIRRQLSCVPQGRWTFPHMTVLENLELGGYICRDRAELSEALEHVFARFPILRERRHALAGALSGGEQQMVEMARALMLRPKALLLDEPLLGLAPKVRAVILDKVRELNAAGMTFLLVEQNARRALEIANRAYVLELGHIRFEGAGRELLTDERVRRLYLGE